MELQNPYITGNAVGNSPAFVGRQDILRKVGRVLLHPQGNAIVFYGQRRIGKTSVLRELEAKLPKTGAYIPIYFDLQNQAQNSLETLLWELARKINDALGKEDDKPALGAEPEMTFREIWLPNLLKNLPTEQSLILLFDEFDVLDDPDSEKAGTAFFPYVRDYLLTIDLKRLNFVFVIGRQIDDLTRIAKSVFKSVDDPIRVSLLSRDDTIKLVRLSEINKILNWTDDAIEKVLQLTCGHPYLTQCLCSCVWDICDEGLDKLPDGHRLKITFQEVENVIPNALEKSEGALEWLWDGLPPAEQVIASVLAEKTDREGITETQLENLLYESGVRVIFPQLEQAPQKLKEWDLIEPTEGGYRFRVELLRRWIAVKKPLSQVQEKLDHIVPIAKHYYHLGLNEQQNGNIKEAFYFFHQAIENNPKHVKASQSLADMFVEKKQLSKARKILESLYEYLPDAARSRLIKVLLSLEKQKTTHPWLKPFQLHDYEAEQIKLISKIWELVSEEYPEGKRKKGREIWRWLGDKYHEKGELEKASEAYRNAGCDDKVTEIETNRKNQSQFQQLSEWYQQAQIALKEGNRSEAQKLLVKVIAKEATYKQASRYLHLAITHIDPSKLKKSNWILASVLVLMIVALGISRFSLLNQSALIQDDKEQFQRELEKTDNLLQQYQAEVSQLKDDKKQLKIQLQKIEETARLDQTPTLEEFVSQLEKGTNVVIVASYAIKAIKMSQKKLEQIRFKYSALGAEKFVDSKRKWWVIQLGGFYSKESANILVEKAINELGFPKEGPSKPYIIDIKRTTHRQTEPVFGEAGSQVVIVRTYKSYQEKQAQQEVEKLNDRYPDIEAKKYKKDEKWLVYIGNSSSLKSAEVLKSWAHEHIANDAYVSKK